MDQPKWALQQQVDYMKRVLTEHQLYDGEWDRLWKQLEAHEIDVRTPGDGTRMTFEDASQYVAQVARAARMGNDPVVRQIVAKTYATEPEPLTADEAFAAWFFGEFGYSLRGVVTPLGDAEADSHRSAWEAGRKYGKGEGR